MITQEILNRFIRIPSVTGDASACLKVLKEAKIILTAQKVSSKTITSAGHPILVWGETNLKNTRWLVNSHLDVVPGSPNQFIPQIKGGKIWGRGAADTKASCAVLLSNAKEWDQLAQEKHLTFMLVTDEETGGASTKAILASMSKLQGSIFLEPTGEKMITEAKGIMQVKLTSKGLTSHGSRPWEGVNALERIANALTIFRLHHPRPLQETKATTFNFSLLNSGSVVNQVPDRGTLWCDIRWHSPDNPDDLLTILKTEFQTCQVEPIKLESPVSCPKDSLLRQTFAIALKHASINPIPGFEHGSSDARHCTARKIPALVFGPKGKNSHADNEWVSIKSLQKVEQTLNHWLQNI